MIIAIWNVRGINKPLKRKRLYCFVKQHHVSFFGLLETRLSPLKVDKVVRGIFPSDEMFVDYNTIRSGRIILVWNAIKVDCNIVNVFPQCIHCILHCKISNKSFFCSVSYGLYTVVERRDLWHNLISVQQSVNLL